MKSPSVSFGYGGEERESAAIHGLFKQMIGCEFVCRQKSRCETLLFGLPPLPESKQQSSFERFW